MKNLIPTLICLFLVVPLQAGVIYVDADANGANDGTSWADAYNYLQDALADANSNADVNEIWVAEGTYTPDSNSANPNGSGDREATFSLINSVALYGGFPTSGGELEDRDPNTYETILSSDLDGNDVDVNGPDDLLTEATRSENSCHVVTGSGTNATAVLDGFTITSGNANGSDPNNKGGGMYNDEGSPTLTNCTFTGNSAMEGGGMWNGYNSSPIVTNCTFSGNSSYHSGGGMYNYNSSPTLTNCTFIGNSAKVLAGGGGMGSHKSDLTVTNCTFSGNTVSRFGGGMYSLDSSLTLINCTFTGNAAGYEGGGMGSNNSDVMVINCTFSGNSAEFGAGMCNTYLHNLSVMNCTFAGNAANYGGGMGNDHSDPTVTNCTFYGNSVLEGGGGMHNYESDPTVTNCILWANTASSGAQIRDHYSQTTVIYSDVQSSWAGSGSHNINIDPCFVEPGYWADANDPNIIVEPNDPNAVWIDGDYHLKSEGWRWDAQRKVWTWDDVTSRCIEAGNPGSPLGPELLSIPVDPNNEWGQNLRIDMGAFGGTAEASMPPYDWALLADSTNDGTVNFEDYAAQAIDWLESVSEQPGDLNRDGTVDIADLALLTEDWLEQTSWYTP